MVVVILFTRIFNGEEELTISQVEPVIKTIPYEVVDRWTIPSGGEGKVIVISSSNFNEPDMVALGENLKREAKADPNANISIFDDTRAAELRGSVLAGKANTADQAFYDAHFVGNYAKNDHSDYHQLTIYLDGVTGGNQKTVKYTTK